MDFSTDAIGRSPITIPDSLPTLARGDHLPDDGRISAMEAAAWLAGEQWTSYPRSVHPVIGHVARAANDRLDAAALQCLWPLILTSLGTAHPWRPILRWRLGRLRSRSGAETGEELRDLWEALLSELARHVAHRPVIRVMQSIGRAFLFEADPSIELLMLRGLNGEMDGFYWLPCWWFPFWP